MRIDIDGVSMLDEGIAFDRYRIGAALVTSIKLGEGETLESYKDSGMVFDINLVGEMASDRSLAEQDVAAEIDFDHGLKNSRNYVLYYRKADDPDGNVNIIGPIEDLLDIFGLPAEEGKRLEANLPTLLEQRQLCMVTYEDPNTDEECMMFVPDFDAEIMEQVLTGDPAQKKSAALKIASVMNNPNNRDYMTQLTTHAFVKLMLYTLVETGQKRFNYYHCERRIDEIAEVLRKNIHYYESGELKRPTLADIEHYFDLIRRKILVDPS